MHVIYVRLYVYVYFYLYVYVYAYFYFCKYTINYGNVDYIFALICILYIWNGGKIMDCAFGLIELTTFTGTFTPTASLIIVNRKDP